MTLLEYVRDVAPIQCGVHSSFGRVAELVLNAEDRCNDPVFAPEAFADTRERAQMLAPYPAPNEERGHVLDVVELCICWHRQAVHGEDHSARIEQLEARPMGVDERAMGTQDWWNQ